MPSRVGSNAFQRQERGQLTHPPLGAVERSGVKPEDVDEVFFGNVLSAGYVLPRPFTLEISKVNCPVS